jgi:hypothetical protein
VGHRRRRGEVTLYRGRRAATIDNGTLRVTVLEEGGHLAEIRDLERGVNPLWTPHWPSIEPSTYRAATHPEYGGGADASLLAGIMGHNLCLDVFGGPSAAEEAAGLPVHGEASVARFEIRGLDQRIEMRATLPAAQLRVERTIALDGRTVRVREAVENLASTDRPVGWTEHATIGPPFLQHGATRLHVPADRSLVYPGTFGPADYLVAGAEFVWPHAPRSGGGTIDLGTYASSACSSGYTAHRLDPRHDEASVIAFTPALGLAFGYAWRRRDFPWLGLWEENRSRTTAPWSGETVTWGLEFGVSPLPEPRQQMIDRGPTFGTPGYRWLPARRRVEVEFRARLWPAAALPSAIEW